jgi:hypothetical protein
MKWIGQHIYDLISRFRNDVYLEDVSTGTIASGGNLGLDSNNKIVKATVSGGGSGDIEGVTAGTGLSGGGTTGTVTLNVSGLTVSEIAAGSILVAGETFADNDTSLMSAGAINDRIESFGYTTNTGDITAVSITTDSGGGDKAEDAGGSAEFSILGATGVGVTNSGTTITAVAVPGEIDHDSLLNFASNEHFTQANITTVGTIGTGTWQGTAITKDYIAADQRNITGVGNIAVGSWQATPIQTAYIADDAVTFAKASGVTPNVYGSVIKLIPSDFMANDDGGNQKFGVGYLETAGSAYGMKVANSATELFAFVSIPEGMKATHVDIFDKNDLAVEVFEAQINATTMTSKGSGNANTQIDITDVNSTATNFLAIQVATTATTDKVYGGIVTIAPQ